MTVTREITVRVLTDDFGEGMLPVVHAAPSTPEEILRQLEEACSRIFPRGFLLIQDSTDEMVHVELSVKVIVVDGGSR